MNHQIGRSTFFSFDNIFTQILTIVFLNILEEYILIYLDLYKYEISLIFYSKKVGFHFCIYPHSLNGTTNLSICQI